MLCTDSNTISSTILLTPHSPSLSDLVVKPTNTKAIGVIDVARMEILTEWSKVI